MLHFESGWVIEEKIENSADRVDDDHEIVTPAPTSSRIEDECFGDRRAETGNGDGPEVKPCLIGNIKLGETFTGKGWLERIEQDLRW